MNIFYRLSDSSNIRKRVEGATKEACLKNFFHMFPFYPPGKHAMYLLADSVTDQTYVGLQEWVIGWHNIIIKRTQSGSEAGSFKLLLNWFEELNLPKTEYVYFAEDDYIYLPRAAELLGEGLMIGDYATLRLHPDKFIRPSEGGNPLLDEWGGESTRTYLGVERFWNLTNSTGMYPATSVKIMREDLDTWYWGVQEKASKDFDIWLKLRDLGRTLVMPIPTGMSHSELESASSLIGTGFCCWAKALHGGCDCNNG